MPRMISLDLVGQLGGEVMLAGHPAHRGAS
jgi:hypothetical protein